MDNNWLKKFLSHPDLIKMGHGQCETDSNIGLGWLYYAQVRILRPLHIVCIGSWRGFVPMVLAKGLVDNAQNGRVTFIDPSLVDDFWIDTEKVRLWFTSFGLDNIDHFRYTTQEFVNTEWYRKMSNIGILFVDGFHSADQAKFDYEAFEHLLVPGGCAFFHDAVRKKISGIYGFDKAYEHTVCDYIKKLRSNEDLQVYDFSLADGVAMVSKRNK